LCDERAFLRLPGGNNEKRRNNPLVQYVESIETGKVDAQANPVKTQILPYNPFQLLDDVGVGRLVKLCVDEGRAAKPEREIGICGEHGGEPHSVAFCHRAGLDDVSCSPFRIPVARLSAAQATLRHREDA